MVDVSVVIPAYNEQTRIGSTLIRTLDYLAVHHPSAEVVVVDDGSTDDTCTVAEQVGGARVRVLKQPFNRGKGAAVRRGMLEASGDYVLFMDADLSTPIEELEKLLAYARLGNDVVIGSRGLRDSDIRQRQPRARELMGRTFNLLVRAIITNGMNGIRDTQCGFKMFSRRAAHDIFSRTRVDGFAFDVEALILASQLGYTVKEIPVMWFHAPQSKVSPIVDSARMLRDIIALRARRLR